MTTPCIDPEMGLLQLPGNEPSWIWAFTCPTPGCACRSALVLATDGDRETLRARGAPVSEAWQHDGDRIAVASSLPGVTAFELDLDSAKLGALRTGEPFTPKDLAARPALARVSERIDGELLDALGRVWYLAKGGADPEQQRRNAAKIEVADWKPGQLVSWNEVLLGVRDDIYVFDDAVFEASELYCVAQGCTCGDAVVGFAKCKARGVALPLGVVRVNAAGTVTLEPDRARDRERLARLWAAFQHRHPRYPERFARRAAVMQELGPRIVSASRGPARSAPITTAPQPSRNAPCPCGSGKKYKKCCGAS